MAVRWKGDALNKVWNTDQGYDSTLAAVNESLNKLDLEYIDLYLIHWPVKEKYKETWKALETLYKEGKVRAMGVCTCQIQGIYLHMQRVHQW